jgi:hypothetical protein
MDGPASLKLGDSSLAELLEQLVSHFQNEGC